MITINFETGESLDFPFDSFIKADLKGAQLHRAVFEQIDASCADFTAANLRNSVFYCSTLDDAKMKGAALMNSMFIRVSMKCADFTGALLECADFSGSDLSMANFEGVDVRGVNFKGANLSSANFKVVQVDKCVLVEALYNDSTVWPDGFDPSLCGAIKIDR